jgi:cell division protein FtsB
MDDRQYDIPYRKEENERKKIGVSLGLRCFLLLILVLAMVVFASRMLTFHELTEQKEALQAQKEKYEAQIERMEHYLDGSMSYEDIIRIAREKYNLVFPDDTIIYSGQGDGR